MIVIPLQSGSNGNCIYVETATARLLFDAGISGICAQRRLGQWGRDIRDVDAVIISHDHSDHIRCAGVYQRKFNIPLYVTERTLAAAWQPLGELGDVRHFQAGQELRVGGTVVATVPTPHDGADGVVFVIAEAGRRLGVMTDLGHVFVELAGLVASLDAVLIESNYDPRMLQDGPYPPALKARIRGPGGHLSNSEAAALLASAGARLKWACLAHLSEHNNDPALALAEHRRVLGDRLRLQAASRYQATAPMTV